MINILFLISTLSGGGAEKVLRNLVNNMDTTKFNITVQTIEKDNAKQYLKDGINYKYINKAKTSVGKKLFNIWYRICTQLKLTYRLYVKGDYDIEVAYLEFGPTKILSGSTNKKATKLAWVHCDAKKNAGFSDVDKVKKQYEPYDKIICVSEDVKNSFDELYGLNDKTVVLSNIIDEEEIYSRLDSGFNGFDKNKVNILAVGRLTAQKAFDRLVSACGKLAADGIEFHLTILGEGPDRQKLENQISELKLNDCITLPGFIDNPYPYIDNCDVIACSSRCEGLSTAIIEAILLGKVVVTTPCTGMNEILGNSEYGLIAEDSDDGLYNALKKIITDKELFSHYESQAKLRSEAFNKEKVLAMTQELFVNSVKEKKND